MPNPECAPLRRTSRVCASMLTSPCTMIPPPNEPPVLPPPEDPLHARKACGNISTRLDIATGPATIRSTKPEEGLMGDRCDCPGCNGECCPCSCCGQVRERR